MYLRFERSETGDLSRRLLIRLVHTVRKYVSEWSKAAKPVQLTLNWKLKGK